MYTDFTLNVFKLFDMSFMGLRYVKHCSQVQVLILIIILRHVGDIFSHSPSYIFKLGKKKYMPSYFQNELSCALSHPLKSLIINIQIKSQNVLKNCDRI